jgi:hypothetical protein
MQIMSRHWSSLTRKRPMMVIFFFCENRIIVSYPSFLARMIWGVTWTTVHRLAVIINIHISVFLSNRLASWTIKLMSIMRGLYSTNCSFVSVANLRWLVLLYVTLFCRYQVNVLKWLLSEIQILSFHFFKQNREQFHTVDKSTQTISTGSILIQNIYAE